MTPGPWEIEESAKQNLLGRKRRGKLERAHTFFTPRPADGSLHRDSCEKTLPIQFIPDEEKKGAIP